MPQKSSRILQLPRRHISGDPFLVLIRLLPADSLEKFGELGDTTPQKMHPIRIRLKLIRKKTAPTFSQLYVGGQPFREIRDFSTRRFFFCIIFIRLHYEDTAEMVLILWKHLQKILNSNVVYYRWFNKTDAMHFLDDWKWTKKHRIIPFSLREDRCPISP